MFTSARRQNAENPRSIKEKAFAAQEKSLHLILVRSWQAWEALERTGDQSLDVLVTEIQAEISRWQKQVIAQNWSREEHDQMVFNVQLEIRETLQRPHESFFLTHLHFDAPDELRAATPEERLPLEKSAKRNLKKRFLYLCAITGILTTAAGITYAINFSQALQSDAPLVETGAADVLEHFDSAQPTTTLTPTSPDQFLVNLEGAGNSIFEQTSVTAPTASATMEATSTPDHRLIIENPIELIFNSELLVETLQTDRATRLGVLDSPQDGREYIERNINGKSIRVPATLPENFWYLADGEFVRRNARLTSSEKVHAAMTSPVVSLVILGMDSRANETASYNSLLGRADAILLLQLNTRTGESSLVSFPRDLYSPPVAEWTGKHLGGINLSTWGYQDQNGRFQPFPSDFTRAVFENACGCLIDGMLRFDFASLVQSIDTMFPGGLPVSVTEPVHDTSLDWQGSPLHLEPGEHVMNGELALRYARSRKGSSQGDLGRAGAQRAIFEAFARGLVGKTRDKMQVQDWFGAMTEAFSTTGSALSVLRSLENNTLELEQGVAQSPETGHLQSFGALTPQRIVERIEKIIQDMPGVATNPEQAAALIHMFQSPQTAALIEGYQNGTQFQETQILLSDPWDSLPHKFLTSSGE